MIATQHAFTITQAELPIVPLAGQQAIRLIDIAIDKRITFMRAAVVDRKNLFADLKQDELQRRLFPDDGTLGEIRSCCCLAPVHVIPFHSSSSRTVSFFDTFMTN